MDSRCLGPWGEMVRGGDALMGTCCQRGAQSLGQQSRTRPADTVHDPSVVGVSARKRAGVSLLTAKCHLVLHLAPETLTP